jgi:signal transduction histidine kinase
VTLSEAAAATQEFGLRRWLQRLIRTPLLAKLVVLDLAINGLVFVLMQSLPAEDAQLLTLGSLGVVLVLNAALVAWALRPLQVLEDTARRVSRGEFSARTEMPRFADRDLVRIGDTLNGLLDQVAAERERVRALAAQVVAAGDAERARIARELHDGTAQSLTALEMLLASLLTEHTEGPLFEKLRVMREIAGESLSEVRALSHTLHPRVLDDLGLGAALENLARRTRNNGGPDVRVSNTCPDDNVPSISVASVLYRVAQEALQNAVRHAAAASVEISYGFEDGAFQVVIRDDGRGFDVTAVRLERRGMGLFVMQERVALVDGILRVSSRAGVGTEVRVSVGAA